MKEADKMEMVLALLPVLRAKADAGDIRSAERADEIVSAIQRADLTARQWYAIKLVSIEGHTQKEAAAVMGTSRQAVSHHIAVALPKIIAAYGGADRFAD